MLTDNLIQRYSEIATSTLGHLTDEGYLKGITAQTSSKRLLGRALTVSLPPIDGSIIGEALIAAHPGDVLVIDMGDDTDRACWGELRTLIALKKGVRGVVTNGCVTDIDALNPLGFPVFASGISAITTRPVEGGGRLFESLCMANVTIENGDLILGDEDGLFALKPDKALQLLEPTLEKHQWEVQRRRELWAEIND